MQMKRYLCLKQHCGVEQCAIETSDCDFPPTCCAFADSFEKANWIEVIDIEDKTIKIAPINSDANLNPNKRV
jgi:hypothetical protein